MQREKTSEGGGFVCVYEKVTEKKRVGKRQFQLQLMVIPAMVFFFIFSYIPVMGLANAFLDYSLTDGFFGHAFAGMKYFKELFSSESFYLAMKNTLGMSFLKFFFYVYVAASAGAHYQ